MPLNKWIIQRRDDDPRRMFRGRIYVSKPGSERSFTKDLLEARRFDTREEAEAECCPENMWPVSLDELLSQ